MKSKWILEEYSSIDDTWSTVREYDSAYDAHVGYVMQRVRNRRVRLQSPEKAATPVVAQVKEPIFHHPV